MVFEDVEDRQNKAGNAACSIADLRNWKIQGLLKHLPKLPYLKFKDFSRIVMVGMKFEDFKDFFKGNVAILIHLIGDLR